MSQRAELTSGPCRSRYRPQHHSLADNSWPFNLLRCRKPDDRHPVSSSDLSPSSSSSSHTSSYFPVIPAVFISSRDQKDQASRHTRIILPQPRLQTTTPCRLSRSTSTTSQKHPTTNLRVKFNMYRLPTMKYARARLTRIAYSYKHILQRDIFI